MQKYQNNVTNRNGDAAPGLSVIITTGGVVATIYSDNGLTPAPNPLTTDVNGYFEFYAPDGRYNISVADAGGYSDVLIADTLLVVGQAEGYATAAEGAASTATTQAGLATTAKTDAEAARDAAVPAAATATSQAGISTTKAGEATTSAAAAALSEANAANAAVDAQAAAGADYFALKTSMDATSPQTAGKRSVVYQDPVTANNGYYTSNGTVFIFDTLQPAKTSDVATLQSLIKPLGTAQDQAVVMTDPSGWQVFAATGEGSLETNDFEIAATPPADGFKVVDVAGWCLFDSADEIPAPDWAGQNMAVTGDSNSQTGNPPVGDYGLQVRDNWVRDTVAELQVESIRNYAMSGASYREYGQADWLKISHQVDAMIAHSVVPDIVVVAAGTNDGTVSLGTYADAMAKATLADLDRSKSIEAMRWAFWKLRTAFPNAKFFAQLPTQRADVETADRQPLLDGLTQMAERYGFTVIDCHHGSGILKDFEFWPVPPATTSPGRDLVDGLHRLRSGSQKVSRQTTRAIKNDFIF